MDACTEKGKGTQYSSVPVTHPTVHIYHKNHEVYLIFTADQTEAQTGCETCPGSHTDLHRG